ncbi:MAG TPA: hypothetical protein H9830_02000 [Candidatus Agrococcus pullicola]|uniref:SnoaL-like domain-containing protein n=1 Tax=Candidatus Agrococcus pullicola TaxID=2838429 RepID=A0A9D1YSY6_9MICO|nr:hypothetical protein [Candidatus Agrococcus pullicola]
MKITLPSDCGNAPRIGIVSDFVVSWAKNDEDAVATWLSDSTSWSEVGGDTYQGSDIAESLRPVFTPEHVEVLSVVTHGRLAACDGYFEADGVRVHFSHMFRFASTAKTARIADIRTYAIETRD